MATIAAGTLGCSASSLPDAAGDAVAVVNENGSGGAQSEGGAAGDFQTTEGIGSCCSESLLNWGCVDKGVQTCVCTTPGYNGCCVNFWDRECVALAVSECGACRDSPFATGIAANTEGAVATCGFNGSQSNAGGVLIGSLVAGAVARIRRRRRRR